MVRRPSRLSSVSGGGEGDWPARTTTAAAATLRVNRGNDGNGGSRVRDPPLYRVARRDAAGGACLPKRCKREGGSVDDPAGGADSHDQEHQEQDQEQRRQELGNGERRAGNRGEPEQRGDD